MAVRGDGVQRNSEERELSDVIRIVVKVSVPPDQRSTFVEKIGELVNQCESNEPKTLGIEWFMNDANEAIVMDTYEDSDAFFAHVANVGEIAQAISRIAPTSETVVLGTPNDALRDVLSKMGADFFHPSAGFNRRIDR